MEKGILKDPLGLPRVALITDLNNLAIPLANELVRSQCWPTVISEKPSYWKERYKDKKSSLEFLSYKGKRVERVYSYVIFLNLGLERKKKIEERLKFAIQLARRNSAKSLFVFPYTQRLDFQKGTQEFAGGILKEKEFSPGVIYIGQLYDWDPDISRGGVISEMFKDALRRKKVLLPRGQETLYPVSAVEVSRAIIKLLFSFGGFGRETAIVSTPISSLDFFKILKRVDPQLKYETTKEGWGREKTGIKEKIFIKQNLKRDIGTVFAAFQEKYHKNQRSKRDKIGKVVARLEKFKQRKKLAKHGKPIKMLKSGWFRVLLLLTFATVLPFLLILTSVLGLIFAKEQTKKGNFGVSKKVLAVSRTTSSVTGSILTPLSEIPGLPKLLKPILSTSSFLVGASDLGIDGVSLLEGYLELFGKIMREEVYSPSYYTQRLVLDLDYFYKQAGFLQGEFKMLTGVTGELVTKTVGEKSLENLRDLAFYAKGVSSELAVLLGEGRQKKYLVLFQDNLELRPTGGFINAYALVTFNDGRLVDLTTDSVYSADALLSGYVTPPGPVIDYLNSESWTLRDSNWDPDFPTAAAQAEWFLDKELDYQVDGVIAIDLEFAERILTEVGPTEAGGRRVSRRKFSRLFSEELAKRFSLEPRERSEFFSKLLQEVFLKLDGMSDRGRLKTIGLLVQGLEEKHVQIFLHNRVAQRSVSGIGWDGAVSNYHCPGNCLADWVGIVESNFSEMPTNLLVQKRAELSVAFEEGVVKEKLSLTLENRLDRGSGLGTHASYIRVMVPVRYGFSPVAVFGEEGGKILSPQVTDIRGHKEAGIFVELAPGQEKSLLFSWEGPSNLDFEKPGAYRFYWRKQAGTFADPIKLAIFFPEGVRYVSDIAPSLTRERTLEYNTKLSRDFVSRISW